MSSRSSHPRKKRRIHVTQEPPFPVPIATITGQAANDKTWFYYTGEFQGSHVVVRHSGDMDFVYKMGFFGKGSLSRSKPGELDVGYKTVNVPGTSGEITRVRVVPRRSYIRHLKWKKIENEDRQSSDEEEIVEYDSSQELLPLERIDEDKEMEIAHDIAVDQEKTDAKPAKSPGLNWDDTHEEFWGSKVDDEKGKSNTPKENDWADTDEDFWGCGPTSQSESKYVNSAITMESESRPSASQNNGGGNVDKANTVESESRLSASQSNEGRDVDNRNTVESESRLKDTNDKSMETESEILKPFQLDRRKTVDKSDTAIIENKIKDSNVPCDHNKLLENLEDKSVMFSGPKEMTKDISEIQCDNNQNGDSQGPIVQELCTSHDVGETSGTCDEISLPLDPLCEEDEEDGDILVVEDSDSEVEGRYGNMAKQRWLPVLKRAVYRPKECLHLSLEESFFLSYGLGCLIVKDGEKTLDLCDMWTRFCAAQQNFVPSYVVYHYFRSLGWVPKSGVKYGTDFLLYQVGPPFYHSGYSVVVRMVDEEDLEVSPDTTEVAERDLSWISFAGLNRATEHIAKALMLCYVIKPRDLTSEELTSPKCITRFKIQQITVNRWIPSQEREGKVVEDLP